MISYRAERYRSVGTGHIAAPAIRAAVGVYLVDHGPESQQQAHKSDKYQKEDQPFRHSFLPLDGACGAAVKFLTVSGYADVAAGALIRIDHCLDSLIGLFHSDRTHGAEVSA